MSTTIMANRAYLKHEKRYKNNIHKLGTIFAQTSKENAFNHIHRL